jgi:capsular exopolysaccharide synthesis family protein
MEPIQYLRALRRRWVVIVLAAITAVSAAWATSTAVGDSVPLQQDTYRATLVMWDSSQVTGEGTTVIGPGAAPQLIGLHDLGVLAAKHLGTDVEPSALQAGVQAANDPETGFLDITAFADTPKQAEQLASAFGWALKRYLTDLRDRQLDAKAQALTDQLAELHRLGSSPTAIASVQDQLNEVDAGRLTPISFEILQQPLAEQVELATVRPPRSRLSRLLIALALGLLGGLALALVLERVDTKIRTRQRAEEYFDLPVVAEIPVIKRRERGKVSVTVNPTGKAADAFRLLGASVAGAWAAMVMSRSNGNGNGAGGPGSTPKTILVTSPGPGDGKTTVAANLAAVYGELGKRVTVISCDLRHPLIHRMFGVNVSPGLSDMLRRDSDVVPIAEPTSVANVDLIPSGRRPASPGELLGSDRMRQVLEQVAGRADVVILDCSPVLEASDIGALLAHADVVLLVGRAGETRAELAERTTDVLRRLNAPVIGVALNAAHEITTPTGHRRYYRPTRQERRALATVPANRGASDDG